MVRESAQSRSTHANTNRAQEIPVALHDAINPVQTTNTKAQSRTSEGMFPKALT